jgi:hypothetical protein
MRIWKWGAALVVGGIMAVGGFAVMAGAEQFSTDVDADKTVHSSLYSSGKSVNIKGTVDGDVFCFGQDVKIDGRVRGDVICAGQDVTIAGTVEGSVRVAGQRVSISADVGRNVSVAADTFSLDASAKVGQDVVGVGSMLNVKGSVGRDVSLSGTRGVINGTVGRNVTFSGSFIELKSDASVKGGLTYSARTDVKKDAKAEVAGKIQHNKPSDKRSGLLAFSPGWYLVVLISLLLVSMALALIMPRTLHSLSEIIAAQWSKPLMVGIAASFALPILAVLFAVTLVGIPMAGLLVAVWLLLMLLSGPVAAYYVGRLILKSRKNVPLRMLAGGALLITLYFVPFIGFFVVLAAYWLGTGAMVLAVKRRLGKPRFQVPV